MQEVTVIVRTFNCDWVIDQSLCSIQGQKGVKINLLIVDSGSTDKTLEMIKAYKHTFMAIAPGTYFPGKVLNHAVRETQTELIVFINSDVVLLDEYAIYHLIKPLIENEKCAGSFGRQIVRPEADLTVRYEYKKAFPNEQKSPEWMHYSLPIAAMKKSVWEKQPFYTDAWGSEDTHWGINAKRNGYEITYVPQAIAMHSHNYTLKQLASRRRIEGEADVYIYPAKRYGILQMLKSFAGTFARTSLQHIKAFQLHKIPYLLVNRIVYVWFYYVGFRDASRKEHTISYGNYQ